MSCPKNTLTAVVHHFGSTLAAFDVVVKSMGGSMDTLGIEPRASRMLSGCDITTPRALVIFFWCTTLPVTKDFKSLQDFAKHLSFYRQPCRIGYVTGALHVLFWQGEGRWPALFKFG